MDDMDTRIREHIAELAQGDTIASMILINWSEHFKKDRFHVSRGR